MAVTSFGRSNHGAVRIGFAQGRQCFVGTFSVQATKAQKVNVARAWIDKHQFKDWDLKAGPGAVVANPVQSSRSVVPECR